MSSSAIIAARVPLNVLVPDVVAGQASPAEDKQRAACIVHWRVDDIGLELQRHLACNGCCCWAAGQSSSASEADNRRAGDALLALLVES